MDELGRVYEAEADGGVDDEDRKDLSREGGEEEGDGEREGGEGGGETETTDERGREDGEEGLEEVPRLDEEGEEYAILDVTVGALAKYPGYFSTNDGFLNDSVKIQDSYYYQAYSYVLKIDERLESYKSIVKTLIHPSGLALFGEYDIRNEFDINVSLQSMVKILVVNAQDEFNLASNITAKDFGKALETFTEELAESTVIDMHKPLEDAFELDSTVAAKDFGKALESLTEGFTEIHTLGVFKPLEDFAIPNEVIASMDMTKPLEDSFLLETIHTIEMVKPVNDTLDEPVDAISTIALHKPLESSIDTPTETISSIDLTKPLSHSIETPSDFTEISIDKPLDDSVEIVDTTTTLLTKYTSDSLSPVDGGNLFFNPYVADPYPTNYWGSDYTAGESAF
jgi:hypothetical protein